MIEPHDDNLRSSLLEAPRTAKSNKKNLMDDNPYVDNKDLLAMRREEMNKLQNLKADILD